MKQVFTLAVLLAGGLLTNTAWALSAEVQAAEPLFAVCNACHNPELNPPLAPPMWGVQRRYLKQFGGADAAAARIADFVAAPALDKAIFAEAIKTHGLMPAVAMPPQQLKQVAQYVVEARFPPPCTHWRYGMQKAKAEGDMKHAKKDQAMLRRFCE